MGRFLNWLSGAGKKLENLPRTFSEVSNDIWGRKTRPPEKIEKEKKEMVEDEREIVEDENDE